MNALTKLERITKENMLKTRRPNPFAMLTLEELIDAAKNFEGYEARVITNRLGGDTEDLINSGHFDDNEDLIDQLEDSEHLYNAMEIVANI